MRKLYELLPGPTAVKILELLGILIVALIALFFLFEWAGDMLDSGGVIGEPPS